MADGLSTAASVIAVAGLAYSSSKVLYQTISNIRDAPETFLNLKSDVGTLYQTIHSFQQELEKQDSDAALSEAQKLSLREIKPSLEACRDACNAFKGKIDKLMRHSKDGHISLQDRLKLQFQDKEIAAFQARLASYKSTLTIAIEFFNFRTSSQNLDATKALESKIEDVTARLTGQMEGLQIGLQAFLDASVENRELAKADPQCQFTEAQHSEVLHAIEQQSIAFGHCYQTCMAALEEATKATGHTYKYVKASNQARLLMGNLGVTQGGSKHSYSNLDIQGGWVVAGNMDGASAKDFFK